MTHETILDMETHLTECLRQQQQNNNNNKLDSSKLDMEGTYVVTSKVVPNMHMCIDVWIQDELVAQLLLAYPQTKMTTTTTTTNNNNNNDDDDDGRSSSILLGFGFGLLRGRRMALHPILNWLEATTGCVFGNSAFRPTSYQMAHIFMSAMTKSTYTTKTTTSKAPPPPPPPLEVTFQAPTIITGIEKLLFTIPPLALQKLVHEMERNRPPTILVDPTSITTKVDDVDVDDEVPILKALHCYMKETFKMNVESFSVVKVKSGIGMLGIDGKCKFLDINEQESLLSILLRMIQSQMNSSMTHHHHHQSGASKMIVDDDDDDDEHIEAFPI